MADIGIARSAEHPWDDERREDPRILVRQEAVIDCAGTSHPALVVNVSGNGALVKTEAPVNIGDKVELAVDEWGRFRAEVRLMGDKGVGLLFLEEVSPTD
jgi:hypothetical protein